jgi:malonate-semialdehyde dehydrogenase (acetylating)/methylmalonate-semialdehyde dehydrogenase
MGAKNHAIIMPDADKEDTINALIGACFGSTGQRCMAIAVAVMVGDSQKWIPEIVEKTRKLTVGAGADNPDIAPLNTKAAKEKVERLIADGAKHATVLLDGRGVKVA